MSPRPRPRLYGLLAEFESAEGLAEAARRVRSEGYRRVEAYMPFGAEEVFEALDLHDRRVPAVVLAGGVLGGCVAYALQYYVSVLHYPLNIGGRPYHSWPAFIPPTFELTILGASLFAFFGMLALNGLPRLHHPLFSEERFSLATQERFFLCIEARDRRFDEENTRRFLEGLGSTGVFDVPR